MKKSAIIVSCIILLLGIGYGFNTQVCSIMFPDIVDTLREVSAMSSETGRVVDENGKLLENCYEEFQKRCEELFIKDSFDYYNYMTAMKGAMDNYSETSDVVISNELISFRIQALWRTGDKIKARVKTKLLQKYVPYSQETQSEDKTIAKIRTLLTRDTNVQSDSFCGGVFGIIHIGKRFRWEMESLPIGNNKI